MAKSSSEYSVGDLMWAKIGSYPYWPCIISTSPGTQTFQKPAKKGSLVHVHFFGDNGKHSWVSSSSLMVFKGTEEFNKLKFKAGDTTKPQPGFNVKSNLKSAWNHAVTEIETVQNKDKDNAKRLDAYYNLYPLKMPASNKRKSVSSEEEEVPAKIVKSTPPKKAIKAAQVESLQNGEVDEEDVNVVSKEEPIPVVKLKKEPKKKAVSEPKKEEVVESKSAEQELDLKPVLRKIQESLQVIIVDKKQLSLAKSLIEKVVKLGVNKELTDKTVLE